MVEGEGGGQLGEERDGDSRRWLRGRRWRGKVVVEGEGAGNC